MLTSSATLYKDTEVRLSRPLGCGLSNPYDHLQNLPQTLTHQNFEPISADAYSSGVGAYSSGVGAYSSGVGAYPHCPQSTESTLQTTLNHYNALFGLVVELWECSVLVRQVKHQSERFRLKLQSPGFSRSHQSGQPRQRRGIKSWRLKWIERGVREVCYEQGRRSIEVGLTFPELNQREAQRLQSQRGWNLLQRQLSDFFRDYGSYVKVIETQVDRSLESGRPYYHFHYVVNLQPGQTLAAFRALLTNLWTKAVRSATGTRKECAHGVHAALVRHPQALSRYLAKRHTKDDATVNLLRSQFGDGVFIPARWYYISRPVRQLMASFTQLLTPAQARALQEWLWSPRYVQKELFIYAHKVFRQGCWVGAKIILSDVGKKMLATIA